jgi:transposase
MRRPPPGLRPVRYAYAPPSVEKLLGALPVVAEFCRRLDLQGIVAHACPVREVARVTHGQVIEVLVANRLTSPRPLLRVQDWARAWAVQEVFGIAPDALNDDRIGRALDAIAPALDQVIGSVGAQAIATFGIDVARLHWDMTSVSLYGAYQDPEAGFAVPRWGKPKDRRPDLKQVQTGLAVSGDGGIPVWHRAYDGGAGEVAQVVEAMTALRALAGQRGLLLVGDSKLLSRGNILAMNTAQVAFIAPASKTYLPTTHLRALDPSTAILVEYAAERDQDLPPGQRGSYRVVEGGITLQAKRTTEPGLAVRCVFVWSSARAKAAATSRAKKLDRARADLERVQRGLGSRHYRTPSRSATASR